MSTDAASKRKRPALGYEVETSFPLDGYRAAVTLYVNGKRHDVEDADPSVNLLEWLRANGLTGTKLGCSEGGCGACTVMLSRYEPVGGKVQHLAVNACLMPLCAADWCEVTTVEGIGSTRTGLHPVQQRMTQMHGSQCGFCTPGIVMAIYTQLRSKPNLGSEQLQEHLDGNLCRCTGYRPILDAAKTLCCDVEACDVSCGDSGGCCGGGGGGGGCGGGGCGGGDAGCPSGEPTGRLVDGDVFTNTCVAPPCSSAPSSKPPRHAAPAPHQLACARSPWPRFTSFVPCVCGSADKKAHFNTPYAATPAAANEPVFPSELSVAAPPLRVTAPNGSAWWRPVSLEQLLALKRTYPAARLIVGATETTIEARYKNHPATIFLSAASVPELRACADGADGMEFGACTPLSEIEHLCATSSQARPGRDGEAARAIAAMLRWFASTQIRNVACLGGNLTTASPISDMIPMLVACDATLTIASAARGTRALPVRNFFMGYRKVDLQPDELLLSIKVPHFTGCTFVRPFKQARRREDDISIVTAGLRVHLEVVDGGWSVTDASFAFGGLAPTVVTAPKTAAALVGQPWSAASVHAACVALQEELRVAPTAPGGQPEYRTALTASALFKFFTATSVDLAAVATAGAPPPPVIAAAEASAGSTWVDAPKPNSTGEQRYPNASYPGLEASRTQKLIAPEGPTEAERAGGVRVVGESLPHNMAARQTTGEALYTDDTPCPPNALHGWLIRAAEAPVTVVSVDTSAAVLAPGVVRIFDKDDLPEGGHNELGPIAHDEQCFVDGVVYHVGQVIGIVVAETAEQARVGASLVKVTYGPPPPEIKPSYTIADAVANSSFFDYDWFSTKHDLESGPDIDVALAADGLVTVKGEFKMGGQEHFYLEANTTLAQPSDDGLSVLASTQAVDKTQRCVASVCGLPMNKVVSKVVRMGGGFGGKETRSVFASCACAVAAHLLHRPVRLSLRRDVDMGTSGGRHPFVAQYTAAARKGADGIPKLVALDVQLYSNGGAFLDLSGPIMDRALLHVDNVYLWPSFRAHGVVCKTHTPPNTAYRGFGGPQGMLVTEAIMEHLAAACEVPADVLREANMYKDGDETPFHQTLAKGDWRVPRAWSEVVRDAEVDKRRAEIDAFNRENKWRKRGIAMVPTKYGINFTAKFMNQGGALVHLYTDGTILIAHGGTEMGQGLHTKVCQVAARAFGVPLSACHIAESASDKVANSMPTAASSSCDLYAMATLDACRQILARLRPLQEANPTASLKEIAFQAVMGRIDCSAHGFFAIDNERCGFDWSIKPGVREDGTKDNTTRGFPFNYFTQGVGCVEVEVDVLTGDHEVRRADLLVDLGSSINPALDVGQIEGAFTQGMGWTTIEELVWGDNEHSWVRPAGRLHTSGPGTYKIPAFNDVPRELNVRLMSGVDNKVSVHSAKAVGEPPFFLGAGVWLAIRNAVTAARAEHTTGRPATEHFTFYSPATTERIRMACGDLFARQAMGEAAPKDGDALACKGSF